MRISNWVIYILLVVVSAFLLWLWFFFGLDKVDAPLDLVLSIVWWALVLLACIGIHRVERKRRERVRTCYLRRDLLFNSEAGTFALRDAAPDTAVDAMRDIIDDLEYGFGIQDLPADVQGNEIAFDYVVRTKKFDIEQRASEDDPNRRERIDWRGEIASVARPDDDPIEFKGVNELRNLMRRLYATA